MSADVQPWLRGRWDILGCYRVDVRRTSAILHQRVRVCLFNYSENQLINIYIEDGLVTAVEKGLPWQHPESPMEITQAIGLARSHHELRDAVTNLEGHAILSMGESASEPGQCNRRLHVMFTEPDDVHVERPVLFAALVDLREQRVVACAQTPCGEDPRGAN